MGLSGVMNKALSGLRATQAGLDVVSQNISNADTIGYVRRRTNVVELSTGNSSGFARDSGTQRMLDTIVQRQLWNETSGGGYTAARASSLGALDQVYGASDSPTSLGAVFGNFTRSLQQLKSDPSNYTLRTNTVAAGQETAARLRDLSSDVQSLRKQAEDGLNAGVDAVNSILAQIENNNSKILAAGNVNVSPSLRDERDRLVTELAGYTDLRTVENEAGGINIFTTSGVSLFNGSAAAQLTFDGRSTIGPENLWSANDAQRSIGTIKAQNLFGGSVDLIAIGAFRSGELGALIELRDRTLVQAQTQLDEFAGALSSALSDREVGGTAVSVGAATGFDVDINGLASGNQITLDYTDSTTGAKGRFTFVRADSAAAVADINASGLSAGNNRVIGIDFTGFPGSTPAIAGQIGTALGGGFTVSNPAGTTLRIVDDGAGNTRDVNALIARPTATGFAPVAGGPREIAFFTDAAAPNGLYTGSFENGARQTRGLASRITVNTEIEKDRSLLVKVEPLTPQGDSGRPDLFYDRLTASTRFFSPQTGIGGTGTAFSGTLQTYAQRVIETQGNTIENAARLDEGQQIALRTVESRFSESAGVNVDQEMGNLIELQNAYAANARLISTVKELMDLLLRI